MNKKITYKDKVKIVETDADRFVYKEKTKDLSELFNYLSSRDFNHYPDILEDKDNLIRYKYYTDMNIDDHRFDERMIKCVGELHYKTTYFKSISRKKYKDIYNKLIDNVDYLKNYFNTLIESIDNEKYMSPSNYLFARNYSLFNSNLLYLEKELNSWYNLVKDKTKERVSIVHNNLNRSNFYRSEKDIFTGWDNYLVDTPVIDIYKLYKSEYDNMDLISLLKIYNEEYKLSEEEIKLFYILISMPETIKDTPNEYDKCKEVRKLINYIDKTNLLIKEDIFKAKE